MKQSMWLGHEIDENGTIPKDVKVEAKLKLESPNNTNDLKIFFGAKQYLAKKLTKTFGKDRQTKKTFEKKNEPWN